MCGIAGLVSSRRRNDLASLAGRMGDCLAHRGPDGAGVWSDPEAGIALAHRRLSIIDLSIHANQPMVAPDGRSVIVFNGEIYNYLELKAALEKEGVSFATDSDTEVLLHGLLRWGEEVLERLIGMFALAFWDGRCDRLLLARDRVGKKPLLYRPSSDGFAFASELKALLALEDTERRLDPQAVDAYLALGYIPAPLTAFSGVRKLRPGHLLVYEQGRVQERRYWFPERASWPVARDPGERADQLESLLRDSIRLRFRSDVPVGMYLSGGVDSAAIAAQCVALNHRPGVLTVAFDTDRVDLPYAREVAKHLRLEQQVIEVSAAQFERDMATLVSVYDEPFADSSSVPSFFISKATKGQFKVVLNGDGGDEVFGGYRHYEHIRSKQALKRVGAGLGLADGATLNWLDTYIRSKAIFRARERDALRGGVGRGGLADLLSRDTLLAQTRTRRGSLKRALWADRHFYLPHDLLYKMDMALMAHGIEGRSPFLDHRLMEWAQALPDSDLVAGRERKILLRAVAKRYLPAALVDRPKHGFGAPVAKWLSGPLAGMLKECLPSPLLDPMLQRDIAERFARTETGRDAMRLWTIFVFSLWGRHWGATW